MLFDVMMRAAAGNAGYQYPRTGLVAEWLFNGNANDTSGNGHDGTVYGATLASDRFGTANSAYSFDGTDDYISVPAVNELGANQEKTIIMWIYPLSTPSLDFEGIFASRHPTDARIRGFFISIDSAYRVGYAHTSVALLYPAASISSTDPTMVTVQTGTNGSGLEIYYNATSVMNTTIGAALNNDLADIFTIGKQSSAYSNVRIDELVGYNYKLTASEILDIYNNTKP